MRSFLMATVIALVVSSAVVSSALAPESSAQRLVYSATWNAIPVARGELTIEPAASDVDAVRLAGRAETMPILDLMWRMRDGFEATVDTAPPSPRHYVLRQLENRHRRETSVVREDGDRRLLGKKQRPGKRTVSATTDLHTGLHDPASIAYLLRSLPPELASPQTFDVFTGTKTFRLTVRSLGDESISALGRQWNARHLALSLPMTPLEDAAADAAAAGAPTPARIQTGDLWISTDADHLPLRLSGRIYWGWVTVQLVGRRAPLATAG